MQVGSNKTKTQSYEEYSKVLLLIAFAYFFSVYASGQEKKE
jgi:hypothetical protein